MEAPRIVFIGAGNVASALAPAFKNAGADILQVWAPTFSHALELASAVGAVPVDDLSGLCADADFYIVAVRDEAVATVAESMPEVNGVVVHTSGSVPVQALSPASRKIGVMYPLQTFSKGRMPDVGAVPFFNEACDGPTLEAVDRLASMISRSVAHADSSTRPFLHVAGVLGCNFTNYLLGCAAEMLARGGYGLDVLRPLLEETIDKAFEKGPDKVQTGPAVRGDMQTVSKHCAMLPPVQADIYRLLSNAIIQRHKH